MKAPFYVPLRPPDQNTPAAIAAALTRLAQSNGLLGLFEAPVKIKITAVWKLINTNIRGGCCDCPLSTRAKSIMRVINTTDNWCLARAISLAIKIKEGISPNDLQKYMENVNGQQRKEAVALMKLAKIPNYETKQMFCLKDAALIQNVLDNYRLIIFSHEKNNKIVFKGPKAEKNIFIYHEANHYNFLGKPEELFKAYQYCLECESPVYYGKRHANSCTAVCKGCLRYGNDKYPCVRIPTEVVFCKECRIVFDNKDCFEFHKKTTKNIQNDGRSKRSFKSLCQTRCVSLENFIYVI